MRLRFSFAVVQAAALGAVLAANLAASVPGRWDGATDLRAGFQLERVLRASDEHRYSVRLDSGAAIVGKADQHGVDLVIDVYDPDGRQIASIDSPNGSEGPEPFDITALRTGTYGFVVRVLDATAKPGSYVLTVDGVFAPAENEVRLAKAAYPGPAIFDLWNASRADPKAADALAASLKTPIVEPIAGNSAELRVTYVYTADADTGSVVMNGGPDYFGIHMRRIGRTNVFFCTQTVARDARFAYVFTAAKLHHAGPRGEVTIPETIQTKPALLELPDAPPQPYVASRDGVPKGRTTRASIRSAILGETRDLSVYTPANYDGAVPSTLLIVFDGEVYGASPGQALVPTPTILDNLIAEKKIGPTVAVLVAAMGTRNRDLPGSKPFADFIAGELVPWARSHYRIGDGPKNVVVAGWSFGGFAATYCAFTHPEAIGNVISQSGSYWVTKDWQSIRPPSPGDHGMMIPAFCSNPKLPIRFCLEVGQSDGGAWMLGSNRELRDILLVKGYDVDYHEFDGGHQYAYWRGTLSDGLLSVLGRNRDAAIR